MLSFKVTISIPMSVARITKPGIELDIETGELLFEWSSLDHVLPDGEWCLSLLSSNK